MTIQKSDALAYHFGARPGKIEVTPTKPCRTQWDLSLAYTPGVAQPCLAIQEEPQDAFKYTAKGNLVASGVERHRRAGSGEHRSAGRETGDGRKGGAVQEVRGRGRVRSGSGFDESRRRDQGVPTAGADIWRNQPGRYQGAGMFLHRRDAEEDDEDSGVSRRPARDGDYFGGGVAECPGNRGESDRQSARGVQRERRGGNCMRGTLCPAGSETRKHHPGGHERRDLSKAGPRG